MLGYGNVGAVGTDSNSSGTVVVGGRYTTGSGGLAVGAGKVYFRGMSTGSGSQSVRLVIYPDNGSDAPSTTPVGVSDPVTITQSTPAGWLSFPGWTEFGGAPTLAADSSYWVGIWWGSQTDTAAFRVASDAERRVPAVLQPFGDVLDEQRSDAGWWLDGR